MKIAELKQISSRPDVVEYNLPKGGFEQNKDFHEMGRLVEREIEELSEQMLEMEGVPREMGRRDLPKQMHEREEREEEVSPTQKEEGLGTRVRKESKEMWKVAGPAILTRFSTYGVLVISQAFIGHISAIELAAYALVATIILRFAIGILLGMASALQTLCGQAYGAGQHHMLGIYLQRSWIILFFISFLLLPIFIFTPQILVLLGQDSHIALATRPISLWLISTLFAYTLSFTLQMYLHAQSKNTIIAYLAIFSLSIHGFLSWLLSVKLKMGLTGVLISMVVAYWIPILGQLLFVFCGGCPNTWKGFSIAAFIDLMPLVKLSLFSGIMLCLELWYNTVLILLTGYMKNGEIYLAALSICLNINGWEMMISLGFFASASVRVANELGKGSARAAKFSVYIVMATSLFIGIILFVMFLILRGSIAYVFTNDPKVLEAVADLSPLLAFSILMNSIQPVVSGVAVGAGWQKVVAFVNIACYYFIGVPFGALLGFKFKLHVKGIWMGMIFGTFVQTITLCYLTWKTDWDKQVTKAKKHVNRWLLPSDDGGSNDNRVIV